MADITVGCVKIVLEGKRKTYQGKYRDKFNNRKKKSLNTTNLKQAKINAGILSNDVISGKIDELNKVLTNTDVTVAETIERYFEDEQSLETCLKTKLKSDNTLKAEKKYATQINAILGDKAISQIDTETLIDFFKKYKAKKLKGKQVGAATLNRYKSFFSNIFNYAIKNNFILKRDNPVNGLDHLKESPNIPNPPSQEEFDMFIEYLPVHVRIIICLLRYTGFRQSELHSLVWRNINWRENVIEIEAVNAKSGESRFMPMSKYVKDTLQSLRSGSAWTRTGDNKLTIFWPSDEDPESLIIPHMDIRKSINRAIAQITADTKDSKQGRWRITRITKHMMRHMWATDLGLRGAEDSDLMDMGGWKSMQMLKRYRKGSTEKHQKTIALLDDISNDATFKAKVVKR
jgi:integrase